jgi:hypothetical protein
MLSPGAFNRGALSVTRESEVERTAAQQPRVAGRRFGGVWQGARPFVRRRRGRPGL